MGSRRSGNTMTRFLEDIIDDTKGLVDDLMDRAKDVEEDARDAVRDMDSDGDNDNSGDVAALRASLTDLSAKIEQLSRMQQQTDLEAMTKVELQELAEQRGLSEVNQNTQTKDEMIATIRRGA